MSNSYLDGFFQIAGISEAGGITRFLILVFLLFVQVVQVQKPRYVNSSLSSNQPSSVLNVTGITSPYPPWYF